MVHNDWDYHSPQYSRLVEIFQACRGNYEALGAFRQYSDATMEGTFVLDGLLRGPCAWLNEGGPWVLSGVSRLASDGPGSADLELRRATCALKSRAAPAGESRSGLKMVRGRP